VKLSYICFGTVDAELAGADDVTTGGGDVAAGADAASFVSLPPHAPTSAPTSTAAGTTRRHEVLIAAHLLGEHPRGGRRRRFG
jgi:hypothetical protein